MILMGKVNINLGGEGREVWSVECGVPTHEANGGHGVTALPYTGV